MNETVLFVEDDPSLQESTTLYLEKAGLQVRREADGAQAVETFSRLSPDLVLLDIMLPTLDGLEVCKAIRKRSDVPVILLTAKAESTDVVVGLELGADDYVTKPFDPPVLVARIRAALRRKDGIPDSVGTVSSCGVRVDVPRHRAYVNEQELVLSQTEFLLLYELVHNAGLVLGRDTLLQKVWNYDYMGDSRMVDMAVQRLRAKLGAIDDEPQFIETVRGFGYRFVEDR